MEPANDLVRVLSFHHRAITVIPKLTIFISTITPTMNEMNDIDSDIICTFSNAITYPKLN